mmetsp:Transcript_55444/g.126001  ORF Transcript_55444/g.126001 Transcript_55444/m.126001 type:complete len:249 (+) Transcript_55444:712-1458(+)
MGWVGPLSPPICAHELHPCETTGPQGRLRFTPPPPEVVHEVGLCESLWPGVPAEEFAHFHSAAVFRIARSAPSLRLDFGVEVECGLGSQSHDGRSGANPVLQRAFPRPNPLLRRPCSRSVPTLAVWRHGSGGSGGSPALGKLTLDQSLGVYGARGSPAPGYSALDQGLGVRFGPSLPASPRAWRGDRAGRTPALRLSGLGPGLAGPPLRTRLIGGCRGRRADSATASGLVPPVRRRRSWGHTHATHPR